MGGLGRRSFLRQLGATGVGVLLAESAWATLRFARAPVSYGPPSRHSLGDPGRFPAGTTTYVDDARVFVLHDGELEGIATGRPAPARLRQAPSVPTLTTG